MKGLIFGSKNSFAIVIGDAVWPMCTVEVWAAGQNLSSFDSSAYLPSFTDSLAKTLRSLKEKLNFLEFEDRFHESSIESAFSWVESEAEPVVWSKLRILDWGPTTDGYLCFLLPIRGKLHLACRRIGSEPVHAVQVLPFELISVLIAAYAEISKYEPDASLGAASLLDPIDR